MNQQCKVCGEPAAGFHFGAFTCEGCKSFFGRSYNNLSSISECKNNGECIINKKNRTACKACRLRKCLMVGMSKSGSRYGRRSNWFKIHCLLQEQQQAAQQQGQGHHQKTPPSVGMHAGMFHGAYPHGMYPRPPCTKEELMILGLEEYSKHPSASPSVSSPDSHNSDSSNELHDRRNALLRQGKLHDAQLGKDLFLPLPFGGLPLMPPPGFLPSSHLMFPGFHPALYSHPQAQGLLKPADAPHLTLPSSPLAAANHNNNNNSRFAPNHNAPEPAPPGVAGEHQSKSPDSFSKRFILDQVLESQRCPSNGTVGSDKEEPESEEVVPATMTPPRSPVVSVGQPSSGGRQSQASSGHHHQRSHHHHNHNHHHLNNNNNNNHHHHHPHHHHQDNPIDLSMKTGSSCTSSDVERRSSMSGVDSNGSDDEAHGDQNRPHSASLDKYKYNAIAATGAPKSPIATTVNNNTVVVVGNNHRLSPHAVSQSPSPHSLHQRATPPQSETPPQQPQQQQTPPSPPQPQPQRHIQPASHHYHQRHHYQQQQHQQQHIRPRHSTGSGSDSELEPEETEYDREVKRMKLTGTTPLDLTTKV